MTRLLPAAAAVLLFVPSAGPPAARAADAPPAAGLAPFFDSHCADCHANGAAEGNFELAGLGEDLSDPAAFRLWQRVHDRVRSGEMPPKDAWDRPTEEDAAAAVAPLAAALEAADARRQAAGGRVTARRLNRVEFETTLSDLLGVPLEIAGLLPADAEAEGFATVGSALNVSGVQMEAYLEAIDAAIDRAVVLTDQPESRVTRLTALQNHGYMVEYRIQHPAVPTVDGVKLFATEAMSYHHALWGQYVVPRHGRYRVRVRAYAANTPDPIALTLRVGGEGHKESLTEPHKLLEHFEIPAPADGKLGEPVTYEWEGDLNRGHFFHLYPSELPVDRVNGKGRFGYPQATWEKPAVVVQWVEVEGPIADEWPPPGQAALFGGVRTVGVRGAKNADPNAQLLSPPILPADHRLRPDDFPPGGNDYQRLGDMSFKPLKRGGKTNAEGLGEAQLYSRLRTKRLREIERGERPPAEPLPDYTKAPWNLSRGDALPSYGGEPVYKNVSHPGPLERTRRFAPKDPKADADRLIRRMLPRAFRRPVPKSEADRYVAFVHRWLDDGADFEAAMRTGYQAIFTSPHFLFHQSSLPAEAVASGGLKGGGDRLDDWAVAERLSYFLWNTAPDDELRGLAAAGRLTDPAVLRVQTDRLLDDPKSERFVTDFLGQWLDLYEIDFTSPDTHLFPEYDPVLHDSMLMESHAFFAHLLENDLPAKNLIESDFITVNRRLAQHYEVEGAVGMKPVVLPKPADGPGSARGGVMTQAAVLKVTANGTNTSPVVRGKWVLERLLGTPPDPPPPGIPAVEPDVRGAVTIREQLEQHRATGSCASCHNKIDPAGVALEQFDPVGRLRTRYRVLDPDKADLRKNDHTRRYDDGLPVDASYKLADGRAFGDVRELKALLAADPAAPARTLADRLLVYATGATASFSDRPKVDAVVAAAAADDYGVRSLLHAVVQSDLFRRR